METNISAIASASPHLEPHDDDQPRFSSSFASQAQTVVQSLVAPMTENDKDAPKTGDEVLSSSGGAALRPAIPHGPKVPKPVIFMRNVYRPLGFHKGYNFPLCELSSFVDVTILIHCSHNLRRCHARLHTRKNLKSEHQRLLCRKF